MTTSSGKPTLDEQGLDSSWDSASGSPAAGPDSAPEPPTPRQGSAAAGADAETQPIYGTVVPYGGDDRTEEIEPVLLDVPFTAAERRSPTPAPAARSVPVSRDAELRAPVAQLALSDLFDSVPASLSPPDPAAFSSSRPPAPRPASEPPAPAAAATPAVPLASNALVALPSIDIGVERGAHAPDAASARPPMPTPAPSADDGGRRSVPTLESVSNTPAPARAQDAGGSKPNGAIRSNAASSPRAASQPRAASSPVAAQAPLGAGSVTPEAPSATTPTPAAPSTSNASAPSASRSPPPSGDLEPSARFASDVPTSRPPDVMLSRGASPSGRPEPRAPLATVTAPVTSQASKAQSNLPSIMLAADVEAEPDSATRRALRAARATVRLELPPNFGRPGSPMPGAAPVPSHAPARALPPAAPGPVVGSELTWLADPRTKRRFGAAVAVVLLLAVLVMALRTRTGSLVVTALGPGNRAVDDVTIFVDDKPLCDVSPCRIKGLTSGAHTLRATAPNLSSRGEESVEITAGEEAILNLDLLAVTTELRAGGLRVPAAEVPLTLYVDGKRVGKLPQEVSGLASGKHWLKLDPEDGSPVIEKAATVVAGDMVEVDPKPAKRDKALVTIRLSPGSEGAAVTLDDAFLLDFPAELELDPSTTHTLSASKPGYEDLSMEVQIEPGETEKLIDIALSPVEHESAVRKPRPKVARKPAAPKPRASAQLADPTQGLLNISSVPPSQIILNGRPLGTTPKTGITVPGDSLQTIVFVHPKMGRRRAQKFVPAGKERTVSIRF